MDKSEILNISGLKLEIDTDRGVLSVLRGVSFSVHEGEIVAVVGESGCGKSVTAHSIMKLNPSPETRIAGGSIHLCGHDIVNADERAMQEIRGALAGMVFQDHMTGLNPTMRIGRQVTEVLLRRKILTGSACEAEAVRLLEAVQIPDAGRRCRQYPHEFSGGMRQRVMIAMALALNPRLLIADEPTTALDVTIQAQILGLLLRIRRERGTAILFITHDLGVVANIADRVAVMYAGKIVEEGSTADIFHCGAHPYTEALLHSIPLYYQEEKQKLQVIPGSLPDLHTPPLGCAFADRCKYCMPCCRSSEPPVFQIAAGHRAVCWRAEGEADNECR